MRVLVISKGTKKMDEQPLPIDVSAQAAAFEAMGKFTEELTQSGVMVMGTGLKPSRFAKKIQVDGKKRTVIDGPFTETKELIASFLVWEVESMEHAVDLVRKFPNPNTEPTEVMLIPFLGLEDFDFGAPPPAQEAEAWRKMTNQEP